jgi:hypothetical protein
MIMAEIEVEGSVGLHCNSGLDLRINVANA